MVEDVIVVGAEVSIGDAWVLIACNGGSEWSKPGAGAWRSEGEPADPDGSDGGGGSEVDLYGEVGADEVAGAEGYLDIPGDGVDAVDVGSENGRVIGGKGRDDVSEGINWRLSIWVNGI